MLRCGRTEEDKYGLASANMPSVRAAATAVAMPTPRPAAAARRGEAELWAVGESESFS